MVVRLRTNTDEVAKYKELTPGNYYRVIEVSYSRSYRVMNDTGSPYLYEAHLFEVMSDTYPSDWITEYDDQGGVSYMGPKCLSEPGFFEKYFEGDDKARLTLRKRLGYWITGEDYLVNK